MAAHGNYENPAAAAPLYQGSPLGIRISSCNDPKKFRLHGVLEGDTQMARLNINGKTVDVQVEPDTPLLWVIREQVGLTGTKYGCGVAACGACSVHINGEVQRSCVLPVSTIKPADRIVTIEGLSPNSSHPVQRAWAELDVPQCGYCQSGQIMAAAALLRKKPKPTDADIDEAMTNICRCGTYQRIRAAVHSAAGNKAAAASVEDQLKIKA